MASCDKSVVAAAGVVGSSDGVAIGVGVGVRVGAGEGWAIAEPALMRQTKTTQESVNMPRPFLIKFWMNIHLDRQ